MDFIMESDEPQSAVLRKNTDPVAGVKVLVVDTDSARRAFISKFLLLLGYE
ncbi:two-component response regulator ARR12-like, partial [Trifolium medium]|nr:two-component response regulator ARR12-like [Trifolium medium]